LTVDLKLQEFGKLRGISAEAGLLETAEYASDPHMIVPGCDQGLVEPFFVVRLPRSDHLTSLLVFQLHPIKCEHHVVRLQVPLDYLWIRPEFLGFFFTQRLGVAVESRLERVRKDPLNETMISLQLFIVMVPSLMNLVDIFPVRLRRHSI
jgi:hypothetical protein